METVAFCEIEDYPVSILKKHWPNVPIHRDIKRLDGTQYQGKIDLVCGGFPCQPFSVAGKQKGKEDDRHLWPEMLRIIKESKPTWVVCENVVGFIKMALDDVLFDLEAEGYTTQSFIIPACAVEANHRRDRVWIIAYAEHNGLSPATIKGSQQKVIRGTPERQDKTIELEGIRLTRNVAKGEWRAVKQPTQPAVCHRDDGVPDRVARLKALGNAVVPQIPEMIGRAICQK